MNMKRLAVRLDELALRAGVLETSSRWLRIVGSRVMRFAGTARLDD